MIEHKDRIIQMYHTSMPVTNLFTTLLGVSVWGGGVVNTTDYISPQLSNAYNRKIKLIIPCCPH